MVKPANAFAACVVVVVLAFAWMARNAAVMGKWTLSTNTGVNLYIGNNPAADGYYANVTFTGDEIADERRMMGAALDYMRTHPLETVRLWGAKLGYLFSPDNMLLKHPAAWMLNLIYHYALMIGALLALLTARIRRRLPALALLWIAAGCIMPLLFFAVERFAFPLMPMAALLAAWALAKR